MSHSDFQQWALRMCAKGAGIDASPKAITAKERRELDALVEEGLLRKGRNHSRDTTGMYVAIEPPRPEVSK